MRSEVTELNQGHDKIKSVRYCGLKNDKYYDLAQKYLKNGSCGVVSFEINGTRADAEEFMKNLRVAIIATHVADAHTCVLHPASATHRQMTDEELTNCGISPTLIRFSCGIENADDIIADIAQALEKI